MNITHSQCQMLPYHTTLTPLFSIVKNMEVEKFLKFFMYLHRLSCYQHIMLFGCSLAFPECIGDGDDRYFGNKNSFSDKSQLWQKCLRGTETSHVTTFVVVVKGEKNNPHQS